MVLEVIEKLKLVYKYIGARKTGTRGEFLNLLGIKKSQLYYYFDFLKERGAEIRYCRKSRTYYYKNIVEVDVKLSVKVIPDDELVDLNAGENCCCNYIINDFLKNIV